jgi:hypothetical protein
MPLGSCTARRPGLVARRSRVPPSPLVVHRLIGKLVIVITRNAFFMTLGLIAASVWWPLAAADPGTYRDFRLGTSTAEVIARAGAAARDVKKLHERPALLEELSWRPPYTSGRDANDRDSVAGIAFSFVDNQLVRMVIDYDRSRTEGLTKEVMIGSLTELYGPRSTATAAAPARSASDSLDTAMVLARWHQADTSIALRQSPYGGGFSLVILSVPLEALARKAQATAVTMDAREAPARAQAQADADKAAAEKTRTTNKAAFKP